MRWLGLARRCVEIAQDYAATREGFGVRLADRESVQVMLGDLAMQIETGRLLVMKAAWEIDRGGFARKEISMAKLFSGRMSRFVSDECLQLHGGYGYMRESAAGRSFVDSRLISIGGGADEVMIHYLAKMFGL